MYSRQILEHFQNTHNVGELENADAYVRVDNPVCGDLLQLAIKVSNGRIEDAKFRARGCVSAIACGSQLTDLIREKTLPEVRALKRDDLVKALGGLPPASDHAATLAMDALAAALRQLGVGQQHGATSPRAIPRRK
jgi:nitrogen fixation NifU-like protein